DQSYGIRDAVGIEGILAEDRKLFQYKPDIGIFVDDLFHIGQRALAVATIVVEEFNDGHITIGISQNHVLFGRKYCIVVLGHCLTGLRNTLGLMLGFERSLGF